ncbi:hypothetical protein C162_00230 [Paenibacillus sp. FSL R7-269]|uniref:hypothetical protein n=1 Tax=Paenibacillus sp. FSL R7-269 TaxID=1226755 RepID=UPI0003E1E7B6|nr:hypothetical protein [Paenibacillus sp. FSL R7-269]ETT56792.1 hypothetical protein C162_00230 [Paenibacillus sp. FSL R7-269]
METRSWPNWFEPAFEQRFNELARLAGKQAVTEQLRIQGGVVEKALREGLSDKQLELLLAWEAVLNHRSSLEKEWLYTLGVEDGMRLVRSAMGL